MGKKSSPTAEELEFIYERMARGLGGLDIQEEMQDTEFPLRTDGRFFHQRRREFDAARKVLESRIAAEQDPLVTEKRREHEAQLVSALSMLIMDPEINMVELHVWAETGLENVTAIPDTLDVRCLMHHLGSEDSILVAHRKSVDAFRKGVELSTLFERRLADRLKAANLPVQNGGGERDPQINSQYLNTAKATALGLEQRVEASRFRRIPLRAGHPFFWLQLDYANIALGSAEQIDTAEAIHRNIRTSFEPELILRFREAQTSYVDLALTLGRLIAVRIQQRTFNKGPCEVCEVWGGL